MSVCSPSGGGTPSQVWGVPHPRSGWSTPPDLRWDTPLDLRWGTPPRPRTGYPPRPEMGYPPPARSGWGTSPRPEVGYPPPPSIASTFYAAGGMPLAFTQEDFLVVHMRSRSLNLLWLPLADLSARRPYCDRLGLVCVLQICDKTSGRNF